MPNAPKYKEQFPWFEVTVAMLIVGLLVSCRGFQCRNANDKLACWLSDRIVYTPQ